MPTNKLKPCPFCGGDVELSIFSDDDEDMYFIECTNHTPKWYLGKKIHVTGYVEMCSHGIGDDSRKALIEAWNTRSENTCTYIERDYKDCRTYQCSNCEYEIEGHHFERNMPNYCPNCGSKVIRNAD